MAKKKKLDVVINKSKEFWKSKTMWINGLLLLGGIATAFADHLAAGGVISLIALSNLVLRVISNQSIKLK